jgi:Myb-like DNA-binding protein FlbD
MNRKKRGLVVQTTHPSRTYNGRVEAPYPRSVIHSPTERSRFQSAAIEARRASWVASQLNDGGPVSISQLVHEGRSSPRPVPSVGNRNFSSSASYEMDSLSEQRRHSLQVDSIDSYRRLAPIFTHSSNHIEPAMTSPAFSEVSYAPSLEPPSMVSDHNSISSASPRTEASPQLLPLPVDSRQGYFERRGSTPASQLRCLSSTAFYDELYSAENGKPTDTSEMAFMRRSLLDFTASPLNQNDRESGHYYLSSDTWSNDTEKAWTEPATSAQQSSRDSRMGLKSLLN